jgi:predicted permease
VLCAALTAVGFGLVPALRASAVSPDLALKADSGRQTRQTGALRTVLSVQVAFSIAVLFLSGLLLLSFRKLARVDPGFAKDRVILFDIESHGPPAQLLQTVRRLPGVEAAGMSGMALLSGAFGPHILPTVRLPGHDWDAVHPSYLSVSAGFFQTMQIRLLAGREFDDADQPTNTSSPVIVNQAFAEQFFPGQPVLGRQFERRGDDPDPIVHTIVGLAANARYNNLRETTFAPTVYAPLLSADGRLEVRTAGDPRTMLAGLRRQIEAANHSWKVTGATLQSTLIDDTILTERLLALLGGLFAIIALLLSTVGLYGVIRYATARRRKEVGIRMALGARRSTVLRLVWSEVAAPVLTGLVTGIVGGTVAARYLQSVLFEVNPTSFSSLAAPVACIVLTCIVAAVPPALRTARMDPMTVLRHE